MNAHTGQPEADFHQFGLRAELLNALADSGYTSPSPIQAQAIPLLLQRRDLVAKAQTGTGKTAAFALPNLQNLDITARFPQVLVLTPTRELALQVAHSFGRYGSHMPQVRVLPIYGGSDFRAQIQGLKRGVQIVVGTPGRVMDHMRQGTLDLGGIHSLVLDEADEMLRMGFIEDVEWILSHTPEDRQLMLFSATMPAEIRKLSARFLNNPAEVTIAVSKADTGRIHQRVLLVHNSHKRKALLRVLEAEATDATLVFARTRQTTLEVSAELEAHGLRSAALNGDVAQNQREWVVEGLRSGRLDVVVATDVAARGIDVERISLVINYDLPFDGEAYTHRIGRTGRAGRTGQAILLATPRERRLVQALERSSGQRLEVMEPPGPESINARREERLKALILGALDGSDVALFESLIADLMNQEGLPAEKIAAALAQLLQGDRPFRLSSEEHLPRPEQRGSRSLVRRGERRDYGSEAGTELMDRYRIEVGWKHRVKPGNIVGAIANEAGLRSKSIGRIHIFDEHSTVDLPKDMPEHVFAALQRLKVVSQPIHISKLGKSAV